MNVTHSLLRHINIQPALTSVFWTLFPPCLCVVFTLGDTDASTVSLNTLYCSVQFFWPFVTQYVETHWGGRSSLRYKLTRELYWFRLSSVEPPTQRCRTAGAERLERSSRDNYRITHECSYTCYKHNNTQTKGECSQTDDRRSAWIYLLFEIFVLESTGGFYSEIHHWRNSGSAPAESRRTQRSRWT